MKKFVSYFRRLHTRQWGLHAKGHPDLYIPWRDSDKGTYFVDRVDGNSTIVAVRIDI
jgi:hypothetical protein